MTEEIRDGTIAKELEFLSHHVRSKLDEVKRQELERLRSEKTNYSKHFICLLFYVDFYAVFPNRIYVQ